MGRVFTMKWLSGLLLAGIAQLFFNVLALPPFAYAHKEAVPLQENLGDHTYPISTGDPMVQRYLIRGSF